MEIGKLDKQAKFLEELESLWFPEIKVFPKSKNSEPEDTFVTDRDPMRRRVKFFGVWMSELIYELNYRSRFSPYRVAVISRSNGRSQEAINLIEKQIKLMGC